MGLIAVDDQPVPTPRTIFNMDLLVFLERKNAEGMDSDKLFRHDGTSRRRIEEDLCRKIAVCYSGIHAARVSVQYRCKSVLINEVPDSRSRSVGKKALPLEVG